MNSSTFQSLLKHLSALSHVFIQTHNFPDHDAVASAYGLMELLRLHGIPSTIIYQGAIQRDSLRSFIEYLEIPISNVEDVRLSPQDKIIIIDGCKGNKNVSDLIGDEIGVIDHHQVERPEEVPWCDIRPQLGACATIVHTYWLESESPIPQAVGTALLVGLLVDTALMTRGVSQEDVIAYSKLYGIAEMQYVNKLLRNNIQQKDLRYFSDAIELLKMFKSVGFCYLRDGCNQNLLGILGDFFLALKEVDLVLLCSENGEIINLSIRSERSDWNASRIIQKVVDGIGFGGGHGDMAGGIIQKQEHIGEEMLRQRLLSFLGM